VARSNARQILDVVGDDAGTEQLVQIPHRVGDRGRGARLEALLSELLGQDIFEVMARPSTLPRNSTCSRDLRASGPLRM